MTESTDNGAKLAVLGAGLWLPGYPTLEAWLAGERHEDDAPTGKALGRREKRRAGPLARTISDVTDAAMQAGDLSPEEVPVVVGSALGEAVTMIGILDDMFRHRAETSPAAFAVSVHNAASGLMSIGYKNVGFATSIAADHDTPAAALLEAAGLVLAHHRPVVVVCADEGIPSDFLAEEGAWDLVAGAIALGPAGIERAAVHIGLPSICAPEDALPVADVADRVASNPQVGLIDLIAAVSRSARGWLRLDRGAGRGCCVELMPADR